MIAPILMPTKSELCDYEPVTPSPRAGRSQVIDAREEFSRIRPLNRSALKQISFKETPSAHPSAPDSVRPEATVAAVPILRHGHTLSYAGIFTFTFLVYFRPY